MAATTILKTLEHNGYTIEIWADEMADSPREWYNLGKVVAWHRRYNIGENNQSEQSPEQFRKWIAKQYNAVVFPVYMMDHSGISLSTTPYSCPWDSGQVGFIYATPKMIREYFNKKCCTKKLREKAIDILRNEIELYSAYLAGDIVGYSVLDQDGEEITSNGGYYGDSDAAIEQAKGDISDIRGGRIAA